MDTARSMQIQSVLGSQSFIEACLLASMAPSHRQAVKWLQGRGEAFGAHAELHGLPIAQKRLPKGMRRHIRQVKSLQRRDKQEEVSCACHSE